MNSTVGIEHKIRIALLLARDGFVNRGDAAEWLTSYPAMTPGIDLPLARYMHGTGLIGAELDRRGERDKPGYREGIVSIDVVRAAASESGNVVLLRLIQDTQAERSRVLLQEAIKPTAPPDVRTVANVDGGAVHINATETSLSSTFALPTALKNVDSGQKTEKLSASSNVLARIDATPAGNWREVAIPYATKVQRDGKFSSAKALFHELERLADSTESPFEKGTGDNRGKLMVRGFGQTVALKTIQNSWKNIRIAARNCKSETDCFIP